MKKDEDKKKVSCLTVRFTEEEFANLKVAAAKDDRSLNSFIIKSINEKIENSK